MYEKLATIAYDISSSKWKRYTAIAIMSIVGMAFAFRIVILKARRASLQRQLAYLQNEATILRLKAKASMEETRAAVYMEEVDKHVLEAAEINKEVQRAFTASQEMESQISRARYLKELKELYDQLDE